MKKITAALLFLCSFQFALAQNEEPEPDEIKRGFKKENLFVGGDVSLSFGSGYTVLGASPYFGYSINKYLDVAASFNYIYTSQRDLLEWGDKGRQTQIGPGAFVRIFPLKFLFVQAQYEHNFVRVKYIPADNSIYYLPSTDRVEANSFLLGAGYAGGRDAYNKSFYYFSVAWDLVRDPNSPYVDGLGRAVPIIRAGYNIALFQGSRNRR